MTIKAILASLTLVCGVALPAMADVSYMLAATPLEAISNQPADVAKELYEKGSKLQTCRRSIRR